MADRLTGMEVFVRAIRLGGLSRAGRALGMSPTMAARHLNALESRLGVTLVNRTTRRLALTDAGHAYLERAERVLPEVAEADADASAQSRTIEGLLRVSAPATFGIRYIAPLAAEFRQLHPGVKVELGLDDRHVDLLEERWDMAVRIGRLTDSSLIAHRLAPVRFILCAAPTYLARWGTPRSLSDLQDHDCLVYTLATGADTSIWRFGRDGDIPVSVRGSLYANNGEALIRMAMAGQGLVYGPSFMAVDAIQQGDLIEIDVDVDYLDSLAIHSVTHSRRRAAARVRVWLDFLAARVPLLSERW